MLALRPEITEYIIETQCISAEKSSISEIQATCDDYKQGIEDSKQLLLELMIPPHYWLGSTVVVHPSRFGVVPGLIPGLAILFSSYRL
jgi:hypothetical protein